MRRRLAFPIALAGLVVAACENDSPPRASKGVPPCATDDCRPMKSEPPGIVVENRTGAPIELGVRSGDGMRIDRRVVDGVLALPIPPGPGSTERRFMLDAQQTSTLSGQIIVVGRDTPTGQLGSFIRVIGGPTFLALGIGKVFVRASADGTPFFEEEDPKTLTLVRGDRVVAECSGPVAPPFDAAPIQLFGSRYDSPVRVRSTVRDAEGCLQIDIGDDEAPITKLRACIPAEAYPFADGDDVRVTSSGDPTTTATIHFASAKGDLLLLSRIAFGGRRATNIEGIELAFDEDDSCVRVDPLCGHVDVPVQVSARTEDGTVHRVTYGQPIHDVDHDRRFFVLAATARPVADTKCTGNTDDPAALTALARAWVATVTRVE